MSYKYHSRAQVDATSPRAWGVCDRCSFTYNLHQLQYQYQYNGTSLYNTRFRVCPKCMDVPQPQLLNPILPPDPMPVNDPRPFNYAAAEVDNLATQSLDSLLTQNDSELVANEASKNFGEEA